MGRQVGRLSVAVLAVLGMMGRSAHGQGISDPTVRDSSVGYIESAVPMTTLRLRFDALYDSDRPSRGEFFYAQGVLPGKPGPRFAEPRVDFQEFDAHLEYAPNECWSVFGAVPARWFNGQVNDNSAGLGDVRLGTKYALLNESDTVLSVFMQATLPTGDADRGLGTNHATFEPGVLVYQRLTPELIFEGELRGWLPIGGTNFAGNIVRYGAGLSYRVQTDFSCWVAPVVEVVGWTLLDGEEQLLLTPLGVSSKGAAGDTIINAKAGVRVGLDDVGSLYFGYGRALTGDVWYRDTLRVEVRLNY